MGRRLKAKHGQDVSGNSTANEMNCIFPASANLGDAQETAATEAQERQPGTGTGHSSGQDIGTSSKIGATSVASGSNTRGLRMPSNITASRASTAALRGLRKNRTAALHGHRKNHEVSNACASAPPRPRLGFFGRRQDKGEEENQNIAAAAYSEAVASLQPLPQEQIVQPESRVGAHPVGGVASQVQEAEDAPEEQLVRSEHGTTPQPESAANAEPHLLEATLVEQEEHNGTQEEVIMAEPAPKQSSIIPRSKEDKLFCIAVLFLVLLVLSGVTVVGVVCGTGNCGSRASGNQEGIVTGLESTNALGTKTPSPTQLAPTNTQSPSTSPFKFNPRLGSVKVLVLLVQFSEHLERDVPNKTVVENHWNTNMVDWIHQNSQGKYKIEPVVTNWVVTNETEADHSSRGSFHSVMRMALDMLDSTPTWDWSQFDVNTDGLLDAVVAMHSGIDGTNGRSCWNQTTEDLLWPYTYTPQEGESLWTSFNGQIRLNGHVVKSVFSDDCGKVLFENGLLGHEYGHSLGLLDLYDMSFMSHGLGVWDVMAYPFNGSLLSAWTRQELEWSTPISIAQNGNYTLEAAATSGETYRLDLGSTSSRAEYLLIENRQQIGFDASLPGSGLLILHVDDAVESYLFGMDKPGYPGQQGWPENGNHYRVGVVPRDGNYDLEQNLNLGDAGDLWVPGDELGPGRGGTIYPNTDRYQYGMIHESGITLSVLSQNGTNITFEVTGLGTHEVVVEDSFLELGFFAETIVREPTQEELDGLSEHTILFYEDLFVEKYGDEFIAFAQENTTLTYNATAHYPVTIAFDAVVVFSKVGALPTQNEIYLDMSDADYNDYIQYFVWESSWNGSHGTLFYDTQRARYDAKGYTRRRR